MQRFNKFLRRNKDFEAAKRIAQLLGKGFGGMKTISAGLLTVLLTSNIAAVEINPWLAAGIIIAFIAARAIAYIAEFLRFKSYKKRRAIAVIDAFIESYNASSIKDIVKDVIGKIPEVFRK